MQNCEDEIRRETEERAEEDKKKKKKKIHNMKNANNDNAPGLRGTDAQQNNQIIQTCGKETRRENE